MMKALIAFLLICSSAYISSAQESLCAYPATEIHLESKYLGEERPIWIHLPYGYSDTTNYRVVYVLDAEWRFDLVRHILFDQGANELMEPVIVVGIPFLDAQNKRGIDLTFSQSRTEYDGDKVDSTWYNEKNSGGAMAFYEFFAKELIPYIDDYYSTNKKRSLIGHSYGGYFGAYLLTLENPFDKLYMFDPSCWYSDGEVTKRLKNISIEKSTEVFLCYQKEPAFHGQKIEEWLALAKTKKNLNVQSKNFDKHSHNSLYLPSILWSFSIE